MSQNKDWDVCSCGHCSGVSYWYQDKLLVPSVATVAPAHELFPAAARGDYDEAREIFARSPKAAGALLRLCLQKLLVELGQKGKNINDDIGALVQKGLPVFVQQALDYCRVIGNNAVHPLEINLDETPETAIVLFEMLNVIVDQQIAQPQRIAGYYKTLPEGAKAAIEKRDGSAAKVDTAIAAEPARSTGPAK
ncbi:DUF4145 domain-containing protein [Burkholderia sp. YIM B11467]